jgi:hypothetical protein
MSLSTAGSRRIAQAGAFNLQARPRIVAYAAGMSSAEQAIALFADREAEQTSDYFMSYRGTRNGGIRSSEETWEIRRAIVRARSALISMRLDDASRATTQLRRLLANRPDWYFAGYGRATRILEASILAAEDDFSAARTALKGVASNSADSLAATILRYVSWKLGERAEVCPIDTVDYLAVPVGGKAVYRILSLCVSAALAFDRLQLAVSANLATEALQLARLRYGNLSPMSTFPATLLAQVAYEQGRFEEAEALLRPRLSVIRASGIRECWDVRAYSSPDFRCIVAGTVKGWHFCGRRRLLAGPDVGQVWPRSLLQNTRGLLKCFARTSAPRIALREIRYRLLC